MITVEISHDFKEDVNAKLNRNLDQIDAVVKRAVTASMSFEGVEDGEVSVAIVDDRKIRELNRLYRGIDKATDVLSFPMDEPFEGLPDSSYPTGEPVLLGDIILSIERAAAQAVEYGHSLEREIAFLCVHSSLHLLGYDHETSPEDRLKMRQREEQILMQLGIPRQLDEPGAEGEAD